MTGEIAMQLRSGRENCSDRIKERFEVGAELLSAIQIDDASPFAERFVPVHAFHPNLIVGADAPVLIVLLAA